MSIPSSEAQSFPPSLPSLLNIKARASLSEQRPYATGIRLQALKVAIPLLPVNPTLCRNNDRLACGAEQPSTRARLTLGTMASHGSLQLGQKVEIKDGVTGVVRHYGATRFAEGIWVGLELSGPTGKNDGSVQGHRYFTCKPAHGSFVREAAIVRLLDSAPSAYAAPSRRSTLVGQRSSISQAKPVGQSGSQAGSQASVISNDRRHYPKC